MLGTERLAVKAKLRKALVVIGTLAAGVLVVTLVRARPTVSLPLLEYKRWPHGAMLRLTNGTQTSIWYQAEPNDGVPVLLMRGPDGKVRRDRGIVTLPELKPGKAVDFFVHVEPDAPPTRVGILYERTPTPGLVSFSTWELWLLRAKSWCGFKIVPKGQKEVWSRPLSVGSSRQTPAGNQNAIIAQHPLSPGV
jgi:hypothetical protein